MFKCSYFDETDVCELDAKVNYTIVLSSGEVVTLYSCNDENHMHGVFNSICRTGWVYGTGFRFIPEYDMQ